MFSYNHSFIFPFLVACFNILQTYCRTVFIRRPRWLFSIHKFASTLNAPHVLQHGVPRLLFMAALKSHLDERQVIHSYTSPWLNIITNAEHACWAIIQMARTTLEQKIFRVLRMQLLFVLVTNRNLLLIWLNDIVGWKLFEQKPVGPNCGDLIRTNEQWRSHTQKIHEVMVLGSYYLRFKSLHLCRIVSFVFFTVKI